MKVLNQLDSLDNIKDGETRKLITKTTSSGNGNAVTSVSVSGDTITYTKGATYGTSNLALGETSSTAYRGDRGKTAYNHASDGNKLTTATDSGLYKIASTAEGHIKSLTAVQKSDITALGIPGSDNNTTYSLTQDSSDGHKITLTPSSGTAQTITIPDNNTTYTFATGDSTGQIKVTPSGGSAQNITVKDIAGPVYGIIQITKSLTVGTDWMDSGVVGSDLGSSGSFIVQLSGAQSGQGGLWGEIFTGVTSNYASTTNSGESDEILLQNTGHAPNSGDLFLRWVRTSRSQDGNLKLQIASRIAFTQAQNMVFKFRRMI